MDLILSLACDEAAVRPDGKLDVRGVFNELAAPGFPASQDRMTVVFVLEWDTGEAGRQPLRAELVDPQGRTVLTIQGHTDVQPRPEGGPPHTRLIMPLEEVVFPVPGRYRFRLHAGGRALPAFAIHLLEIEGEAGNG